MTTLVAYYNRPRFRLLLAWLLALLPCAAIILQSALAQRAAAIAQAQHQARVLTQTIVNRQTQMLQNSAALLALLAETTAVRGDGRRCEDYLAQLQAHLAGYAVFGTISPAGHVTCNSLRDYRFYDVADRRYVREALDTGQPARGDYQIGRLTGKPTINLAHPIRDPDGRLRGLVYAAIDLNWISHAVPLSLLPPGAEITFSNHTDTVLLHLPEGPPPPGHPFSDGPALRARLQARAHGEWWQRGSDGTLRWYTVQRMTPDGDATHLPAYLTVSQPESAILAAAKRQLGRELISAGVFLILIGAGLWRYRERLSG